MEVLGFEPEANAEAEASAEAERYKKRVKESEQALEMAGKVNLELQEALVSQTSQFEGRMEALFSKARENEEEKEDVGLSSWSSRPPSPILARAAHGKENATPGRRRTVLI